MGIFDVFSPAKRAEKASSEAAVTALTEELTAAAPRGAHVSARSWSIRSTEYVVSISGTRRDMPALVRRLNRAINGLGRIDDLELRIAESADPDAVFSSLRIIGKNRDPEVLDFLVRTHEELLALFPGESVLVDGSYGGFTVSGVARGDAVTSARLLVAWWEDMLTADLEHWPISEIELTIGGTVEEPEISYTVALDEPEDDVDPASVPIDVKRQEARRAVTAWTESLPDLEALAKVRARSGYAARFSFTPTKFKPRLAVEDLETGDEDEDEAAEVAAGIRFHHPASKVETAEG